MKMTTGSILAVPTKDTIFKTPVAEVKVAAKSMALIVCFTGGVAVYNFDDSHHKSVVVSVGERNVTLTPGTSAVIGSVKAANLGEINPAQLICYRKTKAIQLTEGLKAFHSEFALNTGIAAVRPLRDLVRSEHKAAIQVAQRMIKTTAILTTLQSSGEAFARRQCDHH